MSNIFCVIPVDIGEQRPDLPGYNPPNIEEYRHIPCDECGDICWIGPKQMTAKQQDPEIPVICCMCVMKADAKALLNVKVL